MVTPPTVIVSAEGSSMGISSPKGDFAGCFPELTRVTVSDGGAPEPFWGAGGVYT
jgi:hypothetical protein